MAIVPATFPVFASIAVELFDLPLKVNTRPVSGSYRMESGFSPVWVWLMVFKVFKSKIVTLFVRPLLVEQRIHCCTFSIQLQHCVSGIEQYILTDSILTHRAQ